jgi:hypothetical protein
MTAGLTCTSSGRFDSRGLGYRDGMSVDEHVREAETSEHTLRLINITSSIAALIFLLVGVLELHVLLMCASGVWLLLSTVSAVLAGQDRPVRADSTR